MGGKLALTLVVSTALAIAAEVATAPAEVIGDSQLVFKRANGSVIHFRGATRVWCGPWEDGLARRTVHVALRNAKRGWELSAVRRDIKIGRPLRFPNDFVFNRPRGALLFVVDNSNETSTAEEESAGSMVFSRVGCHLGDVVAFRVRAVLGSEFSDRKPVRVAGSFSGRLTTPP